jgi:hypothetical protein
MGPPQSDDLGGQRLSLRDSDIDRHGPDAGEQIAQVLTDADSRVLVQRSE